MRAFIRADREPALTRGGSQQIDIGIEPLNYAEHLNKYFSEADDLIFSFGEPVIAAERIEIPLREFSSGIREPLDGHTDGADEQRADEQRNYREHTAHNQKPEHTCLFCLFLQHKACVGVFPKVIHTGPNGGLNRLHDIRRIL